MTAPIVLFELTLGQATAIVAVQEGQAWEWGAGEGELSAWLRDDTRWRLLREAYGMDGYLLDAKSAAIDVQAGLVQLLGPDAVEVDRGQAELGRQLEERNALLEEEDTVL